MQNISVNIQKDEIFRAVERQAAYVGAKVPGDDGSAFDRISIIAEDETLLEQFWIQAVSFVQLKAAKWLILYGHDTQTDSNNGNSLSVTFRVPDNFPSHLPEGIKDALKSCLTNFILSLWFADTNKEDASAYMNQAISQAEQIHISMYERVRPTYQKPSEI